MVYNFHYPKINENSIWSWSLSGSWGLELIMDYVFMIAFK